MGALEGEPTPTYQIPICVMFLDALVRGLVKGHLETKHKGQLSSKDIKACLHTLGTICLREPE
jgi:hypothetical protein